VREKPDFARNRAKATSGPQPTFVGRPPNGSYEPKFYIAAKGLLSLLSISPRQNTSIRANRLGRKTMYTFGVT
jgi:hypothetical protein